MEWKYDGYGFMIGIGGVITIHGISIVPSHQSWRFPEPGGARNETRRRFSGKKHRTKWCMFDFMGFNAISGDIMGIQPASISFFYVLGFK